MLRPVAVHSRRQAVDAVDVKIQLDHRSGSEIGEETSLCGGEECCKLRERNRFFPTPEVESRTPGTSDIAEATARGRVRRQADFPAPGWLCRGENGGGGLHSELRCGVNSLNQWISYLLLRQSVGLTSEQNCLDWFQRPHGNGSALELDDKHRPLILIQETLFRNSVIRKLAKRKTFAADRSSSESESLPGMPDIVQAVPIGSIPVFPGFAPGNARQDENERGRDTDQLPTPISDGALFYHVGRGTVMIEAIGPADQSLRAKVKFGGVEIAGGRIHAQRVDGSSGRDSLGRANRSGIKH